MDQFYVTLPSNTVSDKRNTPSEFTVHLPQKIKLIGDWECGLCQLLYPHNWETLRKNETSIKVIDVNDKEHTIKIPVGCYDSIDEFVEALKFCLFNGEEIVQNGILIKYHSTVKRVQVLIKSVHVGSITFPVKIAEMLGFEDEKIVQSTWSIKEPKMHIGSIEAFYIYANILEPQIVGDVAAPLLRIVNVEGSYPKIVDKTFDFPHYVPILVKDISSIEINIKDDLDELIPFISGKVIVKLHFRKIKPSYF